MYYYNNFRTNDQTVAQIIIRWNVRQSSEDTIVRVQWAYVQQV